MKRKSPYPKCIVQGCRRKASRWDGGALGWVVDKDLKRLKPGYVVWVCEEHDDGHNYFDLPDTFEDAIEEIVHLREQLQKLFKCAGDEFCNDDESMQKLQKAVSDCNRV